MGDDTKKNNPVKRDLRSWLVAILGIAVLIAIASYVYKTVPGSSAYGDLPATFDWRDHQGKDWMTSVKDQGQCGVCGIFASVGAIEAVANIEANDPNLDLDLSEQYIISCAGDNICELGIRIVSALGFIKFEGVSDEQCFPYTTTSGNCSDRCNDWEDRLVYIEGYDAVLFDNHYDPSAPPADYNSSAKKHLIQEGPLVVSMQYNGRLVNDIYVCAIDLIPSTLATPDDPYHGVVMVGYNDIEEYWIMKNQWGNDWPPPNGGGYFKVGYNSQCQFPEVYSVDGVYGAAVSPAPIGQKIRITNDDEWDGDPVIRDNQIVWLKGMTEVNTSERDIYYLEVPGALPPDYTPIPIAITNDNIRQMSPTICGNIIYYAEQGIIKHYNLQGGGHQKLCTDEMKAQGKCTGEGEECVDCSSNAVTFVRNGLYKDYKDTVVRFNLDDSKESTINGWSYDYQPPYDSKNWLDNRKRPQIREDGLRVVWSESIENYPELGPGRGKVYYYDGIPQDPPMPPGFSEFPKFVEYNRFDQWNADLDGNIVVWAQTGGDGTSHIHIKDLTTGSHEVIPRAGSQIMPAISGNLVVFFDGYDIVLYNIANQKQYLITDPHETRGKQIMREYLDFDRDIIVWNESSGTEEWDLYMFKLNDE